MLLWYIRLMRTPLKTKIFQPVFWVAAILLGLQGWALTLFLQHGWQMLANPYPLDYGEGTMLDLAVRLSQRQEIYPVGLTVPPYITNVYPPVYLIAQFLFVQIYGPAFWYGRAISLLTAILTALLIALTLRQITRNTLASLAGGLTFLAIPYIVHWAPLFRVDMLALFFSWTALFVIVRWPTMRWSLLVTVALLVAAAYTKQTYMLTAPLTVFCWLWSQSGLKRALSFAIFFFSLIFGIFVALNFASAGGFFWNIFTVLGRQSISTDLIAYYLQDISVHLPLLLLAAVILILTLFAKTKTFEKPLKAFCLPYLLAASISALTIGKPGSNVNYLLELAAALSFATAFLITWLQRWPRWQLAGIILLTLQIYALTQWTQTDYFPTHYVESHPENPRLMQLIRQSKGPVLTDEYTGLLVLDHRPVYIQPFDLSAMANNGTWDQQPFLSMLNKRFFEVIILYNPSNALVRQRWTRQMLQHIRENYVLAEHIENNEIYRRKP